LFFSPEGTANNECDRATKDCCLEFFNADYCEGKEDVLIETLAREPLEILKRVVRDDRPISDAITLDHTYVTPVTAQFYGFTDTQMDDLFDANLDNDATEAVAGRLQRTDRNTLGTAPVGTPYPHAGLLTTHTTLARWVSTTSNKNRGRAQSITMRRLLNVDVMKFAEFSTASLAPDADLELATQTEVACTSCHAAVDPLAGLWQNFSGNGNYRLSALSSNLDNMPPPAFLGTLLPDNDDPIQFMAAQVVQHERFPLAMLLPVLQGLVAFEELPSAIDARDPEFHEKTLATLMQHKLLSELRDRFADDHDLRLKPLVKDVVRSVLFRAGSVPGLTDIQSKALSRAGIGRGALLTPEQLERKIASVFGLPYRSNRSPTGSLLLTALTQYRILMGGLDYDAISIRFRQPSPVNMRVIERMANEMSCLVVAQDFSTVDRTARKLFRLVEVTDDDPAVIAQELIRLHKLLLNEDVAIGDGELNESLSVFNDALALGRGLVDASENLPSDCDAMGSFETPSVDYPSDGDGELPVV
jgi:hypothetical protein